MIEYYFMLWKNEFFPLVIFFLLFLDNFTHVYNKMQSDIFLLAFCTSNFPHPKLPAPFFVIIY